MPTCPKDPLKNIQYRRELLRLGNESKSAREEILIYAARDPIWWIDSFLWTFNPKDWAKSPDRLFITYPHQERAAQKILAAIGNHDLIFPKSRAMGGTYIILAVLLHQWLFFRKQNFLLCSAKEDRVDRRGDPSSLFWKLDDMLSNLPTWMVPEFDRVELKLMNVENGSVFNGESTNKNVDRGGRRTVILADEAAAMANAASVAASIQHVTNCCLWLSTFQGAFGTFYDLYRKWTKECPDWIVRMHWTEHPVYSEGLEIGGDGKPTSPWYREQCLRTPSKRNIAQEIDMDPQAAGGQFFDADKTDELLKQTVLAPFRQGELSVNELHEPTWRKSDRGKLMLWCYLDDLERPPHSEYVMGLDISSGKGGEMSSQSVAVVYDKVTGEKVAEYKNRLITPTNFARYCVPLARWFHDAKIIFGCQGPGADFGATLVRECKYGRVYWHVDEVRGGKQVKKIGYPEVGENRTKLYENYRDALESGRIVNRSREAVEETREYIYSPEGSIEHCKAIQRDADPETKGRLHGDIVCADAMAAWLMRNVTVKKASGPPTRAFDRHAVYPPHSPGWRFQQVLLKQSQKTYY